jgi:hypothetical protein
MGTGPRDRDGAEDRRDKTDCNDFSDFVVWRGGGHKIVC